MTDHTGANCFQILDAKRSWNSKQELNENHLIIQTYSIPPLMHLVLA
jgi:hypothetical protein